MSDTTETCPRCEQPHGTCHHTAAPIEVGDVIDIRRMSVGRWARVNELRPRSVVVDRDGDRWTKTARRDGAWRGRAGALLALSDAVSAWGPATVVHVAGGRAAR